MRLLKKILDIVMASISIKSENKMRRQSLISRQLDK